MSLEKPKFLTSKSGYRFPSRFPTFPTKIHSSSSEFSFTMERRALRMVRRPVLGSSMGVFFEAAALGSGLGVSSLALLLAVRCTAGFFSFCTGCFCLGTSSVSSSSAAERISRYLNLLQAEMKELGVLLSPMPMTVIPDSLSLAASRVKSLSEDTRQNPSTLPE